MNKLLLIAGLFLLTVFTPTWGMNDEPEQQITLQQGTSTGSQNTDPCYRCNKYPCVCNYTVCLICGENPCLCYFDTEYCTKCKKETCVCKDESKEDPEK